MLIWSLSAVVMAAQVELSPGDDLVARTEGLQPGDEVILNDGFYRIQGTMNFSVSSTEDFPTIIRAAEGAAPVIELVATDGNYPGNIVQISESSWFIIQGITFQGDVGWTDDTDNHGGVRIANSSNVILRDMEVAQTGNTAVQIAGDSSDITIERVHIHDTLAGHGVYVGCQDASCLTIGGTIDNNWIHNIGGEFTYGMFFAHGTQGVTIRDNIVYGVENRGVYLGSTEYGDLNIFEGNAVWNVSSIGLFVEGSALIRNNLIFNVDGTGLFSRDPERKTFTDQIISFNTIANTTDWAVYLEDWYYASGMVFANNAACNPIGYGWEYDIPVDLLDDTAIAPSENVMRNNVVCGLVEGTEVLEDTSALVPGAGNGDFTNVENWDFYPANRDSSLVNAADPDGATFIPEVDFSGYPRDGASPDVGAYEYFEDGNPGWPIQEGFKQFPELELSSDRASVTGGCCEDEGSGADAALLAPLIGLGVLFRRRRDRR
ncbi:MAG: right-handed parallel beta-helix repeat-containing protein [Myxococcota bacterium]